MPSLTITTRRTKSGPRYVVRYRLGGRAYPIEHGGSFKTIREAKARRDLIGGELAAGRSPAAALRALVEQPTRRNFRSWASAYEASRVDLASETAKNLKSHLKRLLPAFGDRDPATITVGDVQEWVGANADLKPASLGRYMATLRLILDFAGVEPNPARDGRVNLPRIEQAIVEPASAGQVAAIIEHVPARWRLSLCVLEQTGMRVGELAQLEWRDVDIVESRFRIRHGKTAMARRWVGVPAWLMVEVQETCPPDDRAPERRVFQGFSADVAKNVMARACKAAGIPHFHPHDFRHRYASVKLRDGLPVTDLLRSWGSRRRA